MLNIIKLIIGISFLALISVIDVKTYDKEKGYIPSIITTIYLLLSFLIGGHESILSGIFASLIALLLTDLDFWGGIADYKVFVASGMLFTGFINVSIFTGFVTLFGFMFKAIALKIIKNKDTKVPFVPLISISFIIAALIL